MFKIGDKVFFPEDYYYTKETGYRPFGKVLTGKVVNLVSKGVLVKTKQQDRMDQRNKIMLKPYPIVTSSKKKVEELIRKGELLDKYRR